MTREHKRLMKQMEREATVKNRKENLDAFLAGVLVLVFVYGMIAWWLLFGY